MAHECPECGEVCYCGGDIDDCEFSGTEEQMNCSHWKICEDRGEEDYPDPRTEEERKMGF
jgi:hypothetical protein